MLSLILLSGLMLTPAGASTDLTLQYYIAQERARLNQVEDEIQRLRGLIEQRELIKHYQLLAAKNLIIEIFNAKALELETAYQQSNEPLVHTKHQEIKYVFHNIDVVKDQYLYYDAMYDYLRRDIDLATDKLHRFTELYPDSIKMKPALSLLQTIYILNGKNREYIQVFNQYPQYADSKGRYLLGQAYYNLREYQTARPLFADLTNNPTYGLRAGIMLGLISYAEFQADRAIDELTRLSQASQHSEPFYDFLILSLARILAHKGDFTASIRNYNRYVSITPNAINDALIYEIALVNRAMGDNDKALSYLNQIITMPQKSSFFDAAIVMIAAIKASQAGYDDSHAILNDVKSSYRAYDSFLNYQYQFLASIRSDVESYLSQPTEEKREKLSSNFEQFREMQDRTISVDRSSLNQEEIMISRLLNEEYVQLLSLITNINDVAIQISKLPNDSRVAQIERQISDIDTLRADLMTTKLLYSLTNLVVPRYAESTYPGSFYARYVMLSESNKTYMEHYEKAWNLANKIVYNEHLLQEYKREKDPVRINQQERLLSNLYREAEEEFSTDKKQDEFSLALDEELSSLLSLRYGLVSIKDLVARYFHEKVAARLQRSNINSFHNSDETYQYGLDIMSKKLQEIEQINTKYDYALLEILYQESIRRDQEYQLLMQRIDNDRNRQGE